MRKLLVVWLLILTGGMLLSAQTGSVNFLNALLRLDSNGALMVSGAFAGTQGPARNIANTQVKLDSSGNLLVALAAGTAPIQVAKGLSAAAVAAVPTIATYTVPATDGTYDVRLFLLVTATSGATSFTATVVFTDESNTARTNTVAFLTTGGNSLITSIINANGTIPYYSVPMTLRCKAGTTITVATAAGGTYTTVTYDVLAIISVLPS